MTTKPGEVYRVDLGIGGKVRLMIVVSREDPEAPRALSICVPITTAYRGSPYEVELPAPVFLSEFTLTLKPRRLSCSKSSVHCLSLP